eukprot:maker-scaffold340_size202118-snap-gene-1.26 protein:Tk00682 transcript:maker-scaffold340_size202118-snap-gene-1.26-mRNA-1 annotation:"dnaj homolog subfamily c member 9"
MPGLVSTLSELFETKDLYAVLGVSRTASSAQLKQGYHRLSLVHHPDRNPDADQAQATRQFQALSAVYSVLSDVEARTLYDQTGQIMAEMDDVLEAQDRDWDQYWRRLFQKITVTDITEFEKEYRNSAEELADLKTAYLEGEGNMDFILDNVLCCTLDDEERFSDILRNLVETEELPPMKKFTRESAQKKKRRKQRLEAEKDEAETYAQELGLGQGDDALKNMIMKRQAQREQDSDSFLDQLAAKYAKPQKKTKGKKK